MTGPYYLVTVAKTRKHRVVACVSKVVVPGDQLNAYLDRFSVDPKGWASDYFRYPGRLVRWDILL